MELSLQLRRFPLEWGWNPEPLDKQTSTKPTELLELLANSANPDKTAPKELSNSADPDQTAPKELSNSADPDQTAPKELSNSADPDQTAP